MHEHEARDRGVERSVTEWHRLGAGACVSGAAAAFPCDRDLSRRRVDADDLGAQLGDPPGDLALAAPDVEHAGRAGQVLVDEWEELFLVLGVDPVGELLLPPAGVPLPRVGAAHAPSCDIGLSRSGIWVTICPWRTTDRAGSRSAPWGAGVSSVRPAAWAGRRKATSRGGSRRPSPRA